MYDNNDVMAGNHTGVYQRFKDINRKDNFLHCSNNSLNIVFCLHDSSTETNSV